MQVRSSPELPVAGSRRSCNAFFEDFALGSPCHWIGAVFSTQLDAGNNSVVERPGDGHAAASAACLGFFDRPASDTVASSGNALVAQTTAGYG